MVLDVESLMSTSDAAVTCAAAEAGGVLVSGQQWWPVTPTVARFSLTLSLTRLHPGTEYNVHHPQELCPIICYILIYYHFI